MAPAFICDAMLGGLARWLRAAGYDAEFVPGIPDADLVSRGMTSGRVILSSDSGIFERNVVRREHAKAMFVPRGLDNAAALRFVVKALGLELRDPRCMRCGGALIVVPKSSVRDEAPPKTYARETTFWRCERCARLLWRGTHWDRISRLLAEVVA